MPLVNPNNSITNEIKSRLDDLEKKYIINEQKKYDVFVSHSFKMMDTKLSFRLQSKLNEKNLTAYLAEKEKRYGYILSNKIREAIQHSKCIVVILTKNSIISASVNQELGYAMGINKPIIPLVKNDVKDMVGVLVQDLEGEIFTNKNFDNMCSIIADNIEHIPIQDEPEIEKIDHEELFRQERSDF